MSSLEGLVRQLSSFDLTDLASGVGGLQLMPSNAERQLRFERLASIIASLHMGSGRRPLMSPSRWRQILNEPPLAGRVQIQSEDPVEDVFTSSLTFFGGPATVFPGIVTESVPITRRLLEAVFLCPGMPTEFREEIEPLIIGVLRLSDAMARRVGLGRSILPDSGGSLVEIPSASHFSSLKNAVIFTRAELVELFHGEPSEVLLPLLSDAATASPYVPSAEMGDSRIYSKPILKIGDQFIVILPSGLLVAVRHFLIMRALDLGLGAILAENFRLAVGQEVAKALGLMRFKQQLVRLGDISWAQETIWSFDIDKIAHVLLVADDFEGYNVDEAFGNWRPAWGEQIEQRLISVRELIRANAMELSGILHLIVIQGVGRRIFWGLSQRVRGPGSHVLMTSQPDLSVIARMEAGDSLALWKFSEARSRLTERSRLVHYGGALDEYALYNAKGHSFYLSDEEVPSVIAMLPDAAARLRHEDVEKFDLHGVLAWGGERFFDVQRLYPGSNVPIYARDPLSLSRIEILVEGLGIPVWVFEEPAESQVAAFPYFDVCEAVAYWLWQFTPVISEMFVGVNIIGQIGVEISATNAEVGSRDNRTEVGWCQVMDISDDLIVLQFREGAVKAFSGPDNAGERQLIAILLKALHSVVERSSRAAYALNLPEVIDLYAPLGPKKKLITLDVSANFELAEGRLPPARLVQDADEAFVLDEVGAQVASSFHFERGPIPADRRVEVLNAIVGILFSKIEALVASLAADGLIERLMAQHERLVREVAEHRLVLPTRIACFGSDENYTKKFTERSRDLVSSSLSNRFLIEYVAACPPSGSRKLSKSTFDELMALASEVIQKGMLSDAINYGLADIDLSILPSGRLGVGRSGNYAIGLEEFNRAQMQGEIGAAQRWFVRHWPSLEGAENSPVIEDLDHAAISEFGIAITNINDLFMGAEVWGVESDDEPKRASLGSFVEHLGRLLNLEVQRIREVVDSFSLRPREAFIPRGLGPEIYPWRFGRDLSYVRRPFIIRIRDGNEEVLWGVRHVERCRQNIFNTIYGGRLKAGSEPMKRFMSRIKIEESEAFNDEVADLFGRRSDSIVRRRVEKIGSLRIEDVPGQTLGDVDVLVVLPHIRRIIAVETKDFELARTPFELAGEVQKLLSGEDSAVARHQRRVDWICRHIREICDWLGVSMGSGRWSVEAMIVVSRMLVTPYIQKSPIRVVTVEDLFPEEVR